MASVQRHHPDWDRFVLVVGDGDAGDESFASIPLDALPLPDPRSFCFRYSLIELNTAVKPWMFEHLFARGYDRVNYLDPDIYLYSALEEIEASDAFITLTPHLTGPIGGDDHPSERSILRSMCVAARVPCVVDRPVHVSRDQPAGDRDREEPQEELGDRRRAPAGRHEPDDERRG